MTSTADMPQLLRLFFVQHKSVSIPGVGSFQLLRKPATSDIASRQLLAPQYSIHFDSINDTPSRDLFAYISRKKNVSEWEAIGLVNEFSVQLKESLRTGKKFEWPGLGSLETIPGGQLILKQEDISCDFLPTVSSNRVIRREAEHTVLVGEFERSSGESQQWLEDDVVVAKAGWWITAAVIAAIALLLIFFQFFRNDFAFISGRHTNTNVQSAPQQYEDKTAN
jgi:nucleoid DNA-binding protein